MSLPDDRLVRFGVSLDNSLLDAFDARNAERGYTSRSEAIRDLIRDCLVTEDWEKGKEPVVAVVSVVFDHHNHELPNALSDQQHQQHDIVISTTHVHLDRHNCLEVILLRGKAEQVRKLGEHLVSLRGVKHGRVFLTTTGRGLK